MTEFELRQGTHGPEATTNDAVVDILGKYAFILFPAGLVTEEFCVPLDQVWMLEGSPLGRAIKALQEVEQ